MTSVAKIQKDSVLALTYFVKALSSVKDNKLAVEDLDRKNPFLIEGEAILKTCTSADQFNKTEKKTKTELAELFVNVGNLPFTVQFLTQKSEKRTLRGRYLSHEKLLGRSKVDDLDVTKGIRMRLVDHRNLQSLVVDGVKYILKK